MRILQGSSILVMGYNDSYKIDREQKQITITGMEIGGHLIFDQDFVYPYPIHFRHCSFAGNFVIHTGTFKDITFSNCQQGSYSIAINGGTFADFSILGGCNIQADIKIQGGEFNGLSFQGGNVFGNQILISDCIARTVAFFDSSFESTVSLFMANKIDFLLVKNSNMAELSFHAGDYRSVIVEAKSSITNLNISGGEYELLQIKTEYIKELSVEKRSQNIDLYLERIVLGQLGKINAVFRGGKIGQMDFLPSYIHKDAILRFLNICMESLSFDGLVNYGQLGFSNLELTKDISISNSDLGKSSFINSNFSGVSMNFEDSRITDTFFSKGTFPQRVAKDDHQQRQAFAQLKKINEAKGDYLEANHFYAKEMNAFYRSISWKKHFWEKLNLGFNKFSNDHGQSWQLGLLVVIVVTSVFFWIYLLCLDVTLGSIYKPDDTTHFFRCLSYLPEFLNPVHRTDEIAKGIGAPLKPSARLVEGISRIFIAFAIYQLIQAFRKHGKK